MDEIKKGKKLLIGIIIVTVLIDLCTVLLNVLLGFAADKPDYAMFTLMQGTIRILLTVFLFFLIYKGKNAIRILMLVLYGLGGMVSLFSVFFDDGAGLLMFIVGITYIIFAVVLFSKPVKAFQYYKRTGIVEYK